MNKKRQFALCIDNSGYEASLVLKKVYELIPDERAERDGFLRVVDESGEDYVFQSKHFVLVDFPAEIERMLTAV